MSPETEALLAESYTHREVHHYCRECGELWPCTVSQLATAQRLASVAQAQADELTALAADIKAYRDSPSMANRIALLARCRGEQPTTTPQEPT